MRRIVFYLLILVYSQNSWSDCSNKPSNSQSIYEALSEFGIKNNITNDELYDLKMKIIVECDVRTRLSKSIYNLLPEAIKKQVRKEKNINKLRKYLQKFKNTIIAGIEEAEIEYDGQKYSGLVTDDGKIIINDDPENKLNSMSFDSNFLERPSNGITLRGGLGNPDDIKNRTAQPFEFKINGAHISQGFGVLTSRKFQEKAALGVIKIKGRGKTNRFNQSVDFNFSPLEEKSYIRAALVDFSCPGSVCIDTKGEFDFSSGSVVHKVDISACNTRVTTNVCLGIAHTSEGLHGFGKLSYETQNQSIDASASYGKKRQNIDLGISSNNYRGYVRSSRANAQTDSEIDYTDKIDEVGFGYNNNDPYSLNYALSYRNIKNQEEDNRVIYFGVSAQFR